MLEDVLRELKNDLKNTQYAQRHHQSIADECGKQAKRLEAMIDELVEAREKLNRFDDVKKLENCLAQEPGKLIIGVDPGRGDFTVYSGPMTPPANLRSIQMSEAAFYPTFDSLPPFRPMNTDAIAKSIIELFSIPFCEKCHGIPCQCEE